MNDQESPLDYIKRMAGWTDKQASAALTPGVNGATFPGVAIRPHTDDKTWAQREYERDHQGWERVP